MNDKELRQRIKALEGEVAWLKAGNRKLVRPPLSSVKEEFIDVYLISRTEIDQVGPGGSTYTGVYDWREVVADEGEGWVTKPNGRTGSYEDGTGAVEFQYGNMAMEGTYCQIKRLELAEDNSSSSSSSSEAGSFSWITDQAHTNK